jgi:hypothetical protein
MFLLMGTCSRTGMSRELFRAANGFDGHLRGGLGTRPSPPAAALPRSALLGHAATFPRPIRKCVARLSAILCHRRDAAGAWAPLPPSTVLAVYGITEQDIGKLFIAGIIRPARDYVHDHHRADRLFRPDFLPKGEATTWRELRGLKDIWAPCCCSCS